MAELTDIELVEIIADALHRSGPSMNPERADMMHARMRANFLVRELRREGLVFLLDAHGAAPAAHEEASPPGHGRQREA